MAVSIEGFVEALLVAPVGVSLLAELEHRRQNPAWERGMPPWRARAVNDGSAALGDLLWGELLSTAVEAGAFRAGPWMPSAPADLADAYLHAASRRAVAIEIADRFRSVAHAPLDPAVQQWWHSGSPEREYFTRPRFQRYDDTYESGQFTIAGMWTVSDPPPQVHRDLLSAWELEPDPVTRWHLPIERDVNVFEIRRPVDWVRLVTTYPAIADNYGGWELPGMNQHRKDLEVLLAVDGQHAARTSMRRRLVPDWAAVAADYDGVHLSWAGYFTSEGYVSDLEDGDVTMLRYWFSERTLWLRDVFAEPIPLGAPHTDVDDIVLGIDVRNDATRRAHDVSILRAQRGQPPLQP